MVAGNVNPLTMGIATHTTVRPAATNLIDAAGTGTVVNILAFSPCRFMMEWLDAYAELSTL